MNTVFRKNLGVIFDACHVITCKTAKRESWISTFVQEGREASDVQEIDLILEKFDTVDPKLLVFGYRERKKGTFLGRLLLKYADTSLGNWEIADFIEYISDEERMRKSVAEFYFNAEATDHIFESILKDTGLSTELKSFLYEFYLFTDRYLELLKNALDKIFYVLHMYYSENFELYTRCQESFDYAVLKQPKSPFARTQKWDQGMKTCYISFSLISKYLIVRGRVEDLGWLVLGWNFFSTFGEVASVPINIASFGNAIGDKLRVGIIEELIKQGEMTLADMAKTLGVANTIAIYHLDILKRENLIFHRNQGRKVLYCLNQRQVDKALAAIKNLCGGTEE